MKPIRVLYLTGLHMIDFSVLALIDQFPIRKLSDFLWGKIMLIFIWLKPNDITRFIVRPACIGSYWVITDKRQKGNRFARIEPDRIHIVAIKSLLRLLSSKSLQLSYHWHFMIRSVIEHICAAGLTFHTGFRQIFSCTIDRINRPNRKDENKGSLNSS